MQLRQLGNSGLMVSELCLGSMTFGGQTSAWDARLIMDQFLQHGGNFIDTANGYQRGLAEEIIGQWMVDGRHRPFVFIGTKTYLPENGTPNHRYLSRHAILYSVEQSLRRLQTDYIDIYYPQYWDSRTPLEETLMALELLIQQGKIRYVACSNYLSWQVMKALNLQQSRGWSPFIAMQGHYNLIERGVEREIIPMLESEGLSLMAWSPLAGGFLTGKFRQGKALDEKTRLGAEQGLWSQFYRALSLNDRGWKIMDKVHQLARELNLPPAQVVLRWVLQQSNVACAIIGASKIAHIDDLLGVAEVTLSIQELAHLSDISAIELGYPSDIQTWLQEG